MSGSVNKVILVGNVGKEPEISNTQSGLKVANFSIATNESWKNKETGEQERRTEWHRIVVFNENIANIVEQYVKKGSKVYVEGQLQTRKWIDSATGADRYSTEVVISRFRGELTLLDSRGEGSSNFPPTPSSLDDYGVKKVSGSDVSNEESTLVDDEVPF